MITPRYKKYVSVILPIVFCSIVVFAHTAQATSYPWGVHSNGTPASQPPGPAAQYGEVYSSFGGSLPGATPTAALFLSQSDFDSWVNQLPAGTNSSFEGWVNPYDTNPYSQWYGYSWKGHYGFLWGDIWSVTPDGHGNFVTCSAIGGAGPLGPAGLGVNSFPGNPYASCAYPPPVISISANPVTIIQGNNSRVTWSATGDTSGGCFLGEWQNGALVPPDGSGVISVSNSGYRDVTPQSDTEYRLNCFSGSGGYATASAFVYVQRLALPTALLTASPSSITTGGSSTLTYSCSANATSASIDNSVGSVSATGGTKSVSPTTSTSYTLTCTNSAGSGTNSTTVTVTPLALSATCSVSPTSTTPGSPVTWSAVPSGGNGTYTYAWSGDESLSGSSATLSKSYAAAGAKTASVTVISNGQSTGSVACTNSVTVTPAPLPDLTVIRTGGLTPLAATANTQVTFIGTVNNISTSAAASSFPSVIEFPDSSNVVQTNSVAIAANGSASVTAVYTFPAAGIYQVELCANYNAVGNTRGTNIVTESDYGNNCGTPVTVTVAAAVTPVITSCSASNSNPAINTPITYTATPGTGATGPYTWIPSNPAMCTASSGTTKTCTYTAAGPYTMQVAGLNTSAFNCWPVNATDPNSCSATQAPTIFACNSDGSNCQKGSVRVSPGTTELIKWDATGAGAACTVSGPGIPPGTVTSCVAPSSSASQTINSQSVYKITCPGGTAQVIVNLVPAFQNF